MKNDPQGVVVFFAENGPKSLRNSGTRERANLLQ
jgi:hypothetical protein